MIHDFEQEITKKAQEIIEQSVRLRREIDSVARLLENRAKNTAETAVKSGSEEEQLDADALEMAVHLLHDSADASTDAMLGLQYLMSEESLRDYTNVMHSKINTDHTDAATKSLEEVAAEINLMLWKAQTASPEALDAFSMLEQVAATACAKEGFSDMQLTLVKNGLIRLQNFLTSHPDIDELGFIVAASNTSAPNIRLNIYREDPAEGELSRISLSVVSNIESQG